MAVFGGVAPSSNPRLAAVVVIDEPSAGRHTGGDVSAPVFAQIMSGALRFMAVAPDKPIGEAQRPAPARSAPQKRTVVMR